MIDKAEIGRYVFIVGSNGVVQYPIRAAANLTGLSIDTLRAWERRYQAVKPVRNERGRAYGEGQIQRLILLRSVVAGGHAIGQVASLSDSELEKLLERPTNTPEPPSGAKVAMRGTGDGLQTVVGAIESFDYATANADLGRMAALLPVREFLNEVVIPLMRLVGERWHDGTLTIAQEHMTSSILRNLLGGMMRLGTPSSPPQRILFATLAGELHEFGILVSAILSVASGCEALYLGPNLPAQEVVNAAARTSPRAVVLGIRSSQPSESSLEAIQTIASALPSQTELWLGGSEFKKHTPSVDSDRVFVLEDLTEFELHLARLKRGIR
jgi:MerR family transcriptional regulator, light-induced transcriptional regulator